MADGGLTISGGSGGVTAHLEDLLEAARLLDAEGDAARECAGDVARHLLDGDLLEAAVLCPGEVAAAEAALASSGAVATALGVELEALAELSELAAEAYREVDERLAQLEELGYFALGYGAGTVLPGVLLAVAAGGGALLATNPALALLLQQYGDELAAGGLAELQETLYDHPWLQELLTRSAPGLVQGTATTLTAGNPALLAWLTGGHWPTTDYAGSVSGLIALGNRFGAFADEGEYAVTPAGEQVVADLGQDRFLSEVMALQRDLASDPAEVRVITVPQTDGSAAYVVQLPGTQEWSPVRGDNPVDLTTNLHLMAMQEQTRMQESVRAAMVAAGVPSGAPVMLTGHSQGGITAATLATDPSFRNSYDVRAVVTAGSPIGRFEIPEDTSVMSLETSQDVVPRLDGRDNPDAPHWVTVEQDLSEGGAANPDQELMAAHSLENYEQVGATIDASVVETVEEWRRDNAIFFSDRASAQDYRIDRVD